MNETQLIKFLNTVRANASQVYQDRIPVATRDNIEEIRTIMTDDGNVIVANEFLELTANKFYRTQLIMKLFGNPLKPLKKGTKPLGDTVEEIYVNFIKGDVYDRQGLDLLNRKKPDVKTIYHRMNYKMKYKITLEDGDLYKAFSSYENLDSFLRARVQALYNSANKDEFLNMKQLIKSAIDNKAVKVLPIVDPLVSDANGKEFIKTIKTVSGLMTFPSTDYNGYLTAQSVDTLPIETMSDYSEQILILDTATNVSVAVDVLAAAFNMSVVEFNNTRKIVIDHFPDPSICAFLCDEQFFQVFDDKFVIKPWENPEGLYTNYILHVWQTLAYSPLVNAVAFVKEDATTGE